MTDILEDEELVPPDKPDFRRVGRGIPFVLNPEGKRTRYGRPSNAGKILDDDSNLTDWKLRTTVVGAAQRPELMALVSTLDPQQEKGKLREIAEECLVAGKGLERQVKGTAVHSMFDHLDRGDDWSPAPQWMDLCASYLQALDYWGLQVVDIEAHCINDEFRLAGSMDRRYRLTKVLVAPDGTVIPIGTVIAADTKTGAVLEYASGSYATQLAAYAHSVRYNVETDEREPFNPPTFTDWGLIVHADAGGSEVQMYWVDLNAGLEGLKLAREVKGWRTRQDLLTLGPGPVMLSAAPAPSSPVQAPVVPQDGSRLAGLLSHTRERVRAILAHSEVAGKQLQRLWPVGIPGLKAGGHTWDQLQEVIAVVEVVEREHSVPFFPAWVDPENPQANHPSNYVDKWARPQSAEPASDSERMNIQDAINCHPRKELLRSWVGKAVEGGIDHSRDTYALSQALLEFASIKTDDWPTETISHDEALNVFLDGTLRALGYQRGLLDLGRIDPAHAPEIMSAALAITSGQGMLLYGADGHPVFRAHIVKG